MVNIIENFLISLSFLMVFFWILLLYYWGKLIYYIYHKEPKYWKKLYINKPFPRPRSKTFYNFYFGKGDFNNKTIRKYKLRIRLFLWTSILLFILILLSIIVVAKPKLIFDPF